MALTGTFERTMDDKLRLAIPRQMREGFRDGESEELYLAPGNEGCLSLYSLQGFEAFAAKMASVSTGRVQVRNFLRLYYSQAERVQVDKQSRIRIPERLAKMADLQHDVVLIGVHDHVEIWDKGRWESFLAQNASQFDALTTEALDLTSPFGGTNLSGGAG
ncbi:MAG: division/cell wall cluster transcriptional repressor MraZ [Planctomycetaceae bacterium]|nr:division/cell wall cluster transcriptional repressor MraZ [Planctomycetaceae bacterium]